MKKSTVVASTVATTATATATTAVAIIGSSPTIAIIMAAAPVFAAGAVLYGLCRLFED